MQIGSGIKDIFLDTPSSFWKGFASTTIIKPIQFAWQETKIWGSALGMGMNYGLGQIGGGLYNFGQSIWNETKIWGSALGMGMGYGASQIGSFSGRLINDFAIKPVSIGLERFGSLTRDVFRSTIERTRTFAIQHSVQIQYVGRGIKEFGQYSSKIGLYGMTVSFATIPINPTLGVSIAGTSYVYGQAADAVTFIGLSIEEYGNYLMGAYR